MSKPSLNKTSFANQAKLEGLASNFSFISISSAFYLILGTTGGMIAHYNHSSLLPALNIQLMQNNWMNPIAIVALTTGILLISSYLLEGWSHSYLKAKASIAAYFGPLNVLSLVYLAVISSVSEELFFRAGLLPYTGIFWGGLVFGLVHLGPNGRISAWTLWAGVAGVLLGWVYQTTNSLWPVWSIHFLVNLVGMISLRRSYLRTLEYVQKTPGLNIEGRL